MKKIITLILSILLLAGCGSSGVKDAIEKNFNDYKKIFKEGVSASSSEDDITIKYTTAFIDAIYDFEYEIKTIEEDKDKATATVIIKTINLTKFIEEYSQDAEIEKLSEQLLDEEDETKANELVETLISKLQTFISKYKKDYEKELQIPLVKNNDNWEIDSTYDFNQKISEAVLSSATE